ncbi:MAG: hypothetical protein PVJ89_06055 [Planctomycetota bacterium]|jgi:hypothetical protein
MGRRRSAPRSERSLALQEARRVPRTRAGTLAAAVALLAAALGPLLTERSLDVVSREFGVLATRSPFTGSLSPFLLTYLAAGCTAAGAALLLTLRRPGWWVTMSGAAMGLADLARLYVRLFGSINPDHPRADEVTLELVGIVAVPAAAYLLVAVLLCLRPVRVAFRVSSAGPRARGGGQGGEGPPRERRPEEG